MNSKGNTMATMDGKHMTKDEALDLALEALEVANSLIDGYYLPKEKAWLPEIEEAITAIKQARSAPVVPDVLTTAEGEHPEYVQGWNDCRQLMLQTRNNQHD
jgi:hypothetical protein